jgi:hypothetical protein
VKSSFITRIYILYLSLQLYNKLDNMASRKDNERKDDTTTTSTTNLTDDTTTTSLTQTQQQQREEEEQYHQIDRALDETKDNIRKTIDDARSQIPRYTQAVNDYQEQTIQAAREIADSYLESQKKIIDSFQSAWGPYTENLFRTNWMSPRSIAELYANIVSSFANNMITAIRLTNNMIFANMDAFKTPVQQAKDSTKELSRIGVNTAKTFEQASTRDNTRLTGTTTRVSVGTEEKERQDR